MHIPTGNYCVTFGMNSETAICSPWFDWLWFSANHWEHRDQDGTPVRPTLLCYWLDHSQGPEDHRLEVAHTTHTHTHECGLTAHIITIYAPLLSILLHSLPSPLLSSPAVSLLPCCLSPPSVGKILSKYRSGKLPKAFKVIPSLSNWEEVSTTPTHTSLTHTFPTPTPPPPTGITSHQPRGVVSGRNVPGYSPLCFQHENGQGPALLQPGFAAAREGRHCGVPTTQPPPLHGSEEGAV